jgi:hypothetical protein
MAYRNLQQSKEWLIQIADRAVKLLKEEPGQPEQMRWANRRLSEANLLAETPPPSSPRNWADQAIAQNLDLIDDSMEWWQERGIFPEKAETFEGLIVQLIPSEGGL